MSAMINPEIRDLQQKVEDLRVNLAETQGKIEEIRRVSAQTDRQTTKQFVAFFITMVIAVVASLVGTSIFQTDALRREMNVRFESGEKNMNQRFDSVEQRMGGLEKRMERIEKSLDELNKELRTQRR